MGGVSGRWAHDRCEQKMINNHNHTTNNNNNNDNNDTFSPGLGWGMYMFIPPSKCPLKVLATGK